MLHIRNEKKIGRKNPTLQSRTPDRPRPPSPSFLWRSTGSHLGLAPLKVSLARCPDACVVRSPAQRSSAAKEPRCIPDPTMHPDFFAIPKACTASRIPEPRGAAAAEFTVDLQVAEDHNRLSDLRGLHAQVEHTHTHTHTHTRKPSASPERKSCPISPPLCLHGSLLAIRYLWGIQKAKQLNIQESDAPAGHMDGANVDESCPMSPERTAKSTRHKNIHQPPHLFSNQLAIPFKHDDASLHATSMLTLGCATDVPQCSNAVESFHEDVPRPALNDITNVH